jgi:hypothetical protein
MCKVCGCQINEHEEVNDKPYMWLNVALLSRAAEWMRDLHGLGEGSEQFTGRFSIPVVETLPGLRRSDRARKSDPQYLIRL